MNISALIDSLMVYAQENLLLDELDLIFTRNRIIQRLELTDYEEYDIDVDMIEGMQNPYQLLNQISAYAVESGITTEEYRQQLENEIMSYLIKRPSEIADTFGELIEQGKTSKAFMWLSEYNLKSGYIKFQNILRHWEAKGTKGKIEVFVAKTPKQELNKYPACNMCPQIEGFGDYIAMRRAPITLADNVFSWQLEENPYLPGLGYVVNQAHEGIQIDKNALEIIFDFAELAPNYFVVASPKEGHGCFTAAVKQSPMHKAPDLRKYKSVEYPYINITEVDWYTNVLRLSCTNREKLVEFAQKLVDAFEAAREGNFVAVSVRKSDKYTVELLLQNSTLAVQEKNSNLYSSNPSLLAIMGLFVLPESMDAEIKQMEMFLTKETKFNEANLTENMQKHKGMIQKLLKEIGSTKISSVEAQIDIKEEINNICEATLADVRVYAKEQDSTPELVEFLTTLDIK